jgi:HEAT repeat protein
MKQIVFIPLALLLGSTTIAADIDPIKIALLVDGMANRGSSFDATELHTLGVDGLAAVIDHLLPDTAPPPKPIVSGLPEAEVRSLIDRLDAEEFNAREVATEELIEKARGSRPLVHDAARSQSLEVRMRAERVLASWEPRYAERLNAYLSGFWVYLEGIGDSPRLQLLAQRTVQAFQQGMPEGDRLHLLRLCIAGVAHGRDDASCDVLRPLVRHDDVQIAALVTETTGAYKADARFVPQLLVDALTNDRAPIVEAALRFVVGCQDGKRRENVRLALQTIFHRGEESLKFQACLPLIRDFQNVDAWLYVLDQATSNDANRVRTVLNWIGDSKNCGQPPDPRLGQRLAELLASNSSDQRRTAALVLGTFAGENTARRLIDLLGDSETNLVRQVEVSLSAQPDRTLMQRLLSNAASNHRDGVVRERALQLLKKLAN